LDRVFDLVDATRHGGSDHNHPPYNVERLSDDKCQITLALPGYSAEGITVTAEQNMLTLQGHRPDKGKGTYIYQGISPSPFRRQFTLAAYVRVEGARFDDGLLKVDLVRERPEAMKTATSRSTVWPRQLSRGLNPKRPNRKVGEGPFASRAARMARSSSLITDVKSEPIS
jgi:molecular chaperone IbpA